jgi:hypothetical protein
LRLKIGFHAFCSKDVKFINFYQKYFSNAVTQYDVTHICDFIKTKGSKGTVNSTCTGILKSWKGKEKDELLESKIYHSIIEKHGNLTAYTESQIVDIFLEMFGQLLTANCLPYTDFETLIKETIGNYNERNLGYELADITYKIS